MDRVLHLASAPPPCLPRRPSCPPAALPAPAGGSARKFHADAAQPGALRHVEAPHLFAAVIGNRHHQLRLRWKIVAQVEGEHCAKRWIRRRPVPGHRSETGSSGGRLSEKVEQICVAHREQVRGLVQRLALSSRSEL